MLCKNCGKVLPDNTKFCSECGALVEQQTSPVQPVQPMQIPPKKRKTPFVIGIAVVLVFGLIGNLIARYVIAPSYTDDAVSAVTPSDSTASGAYARIFSDRYIVVMPSVFTTDNYAAYAKVDENGIVYHNEFVYDDNNIVLELFETVYWPVSDYTDEQKEVIKTNIQNFTSTLPGTVCTVTYYWGYSYYSCTVKYQNLNNMDNIKLLVENDLVTNDNSLISMSTAEKDLLNDGFVKK